MKIIYFFFVIGFAVSLLFMNDNCKAQTIDELKLTIKQLEAKNSNLENQLKKSKQNTGSKKCTELEKQILQLQEEKAELIRENIRLRGKENPVAQDSASHFIELDISDMYFKAYLLKYCDMDNDGRFSQWDADHTYIIDLENESNSLYRNKESESLDLDGLKYFTNLKKLVCSGNNIRTLNLEKNANLETLIANNCNLKILNVSKNLKLKHLECNRNLLYVLNLDSNLDLLKVDASKNKLDELTISNCKKLTYLSCAHNTIEKLDVSDNVGLSIVDCSNNKISQLSFVTNTSMDSLFCNNNSLTSLDIRNKKDIKYLDCSKNRNLVEVLISEGHVVLSEKKDNKTRITTEL